MFEQTIGYSFSDKGLMTLAITHSSYTNEHKLPPASSNERLEYLGDAVLELSVSDHIFAGYAGLSEGEMTKLRASVVCEPMLAKAARRINLGDAIRMGRGEEQSGGRKRDSIISDAFEALIGAIFKDGGFEAARDFVTAQLADDIKMMSTRFNQSDPKTYLQECIQAYSAVPLVYAIIGEHGPDHNKVFSVHLTHEGKVIGEGTGRSKKEAEQDAASDAIDKMGFGSNR